MFYSTHFENGLVRLDEEESRHLVTVLRRGVGDKLELTDGKGCFYEAELVEVQKKYVLARVLKQTEAATGRAQKIHLAIAPTKQTERMEWLLEKATEIGVDEITPLICRRSERDSLRLDRLEKILVSAMKQSLRAWLPRLNPPTRFPDFVRQSAEPSRFIAWCAQHPLPHLKSLLQPGQDCVMAIGPEGDFHPEEVEAALRAGFQEVSLGTARLRTETAGLYAVMLANY